MSQFTWNTDHSWETIDTDWLDTVEEAPAWVDIDERSVGLGERLSFMGAFWDGCRVYARFFVLFAMVALLTYGLEQGAKWLVTSGSVLGWWLALPLRFVGFCLGVMVMLGMMTEWTEAMVHHVSQSESEKRSMWSSFVEAVSVSFGKLPQIWLTGLLVSVIVAFFGAIAFFLVGLFATVFGLQGVVFALLSVTAVLGSFVAAVLFAFVPIVCIREELVGLDAISRSMDLVKGRKWRVFCGMFVAFVAVLLLSFATYMAFSYGLSGMGVVSTGTLDRMEDSMIDVLLSLFLPLFFLTLHSMYFRIRAEETGRIWSPRSFRSIFD